MTNSTMPGRQNAVQAYGRVELEALVLGSKGPQLVQLCFDEALKSLDLALSMHNAANFPMRSQTLSRALLAIFALRSGVDETSPMAPVLLEFYGELANGVTNAIVHFKPESLRALRADVAEIREALV